MDFGALVLIVLLAIPVFFFWRWIFRKYAPRVRKLIMIWLITVLTTPVLYCALILIYFFLLEYYPNHHFDQQVWKADSDTRYEYSHDLVNSKILIGKTKKQVIQVLGNTDTSNNEIYYYIGYRPEIAGIDPSSIVIDFKNEKVDTVIEHDR